MTSKPTYHFGILIAFVSGFLWLFQEPLAQLISIIWANDGYQYGLAVPIISAVLIYTRRKWLKPATIAFDPLGIWVLLACVFFTGAGVLGEASLFNHIAIVLGLLGGALLILGRQFLSPIVFPLAYLIFMVPAGDQLIPYLQSMTAEGAVLALQMLKVDVRLVGDVIILPSGGFEVSEACAGLRFLMVSLTTGILLAWMNFSSWQGRFKLMVWAVSIPIVANILRVWTILLLADGYDVSFAKSVDHIIYGWVFMSIVLTALVAVSFRLSDHDAINSAPAIYTLKTPTANVTVGSVVLVFFSLLGLLFAGAGYSTGQLATDGVANTCPNSADDVWVMQSASQLRAMKGVSPLWLSGFDKITPTKIKLFRSGGNVIQLETMATRAPAAIKALISRRERPVVPPWGIFAAVKGGWKESDGLVFYEYAVTDRKHEFLVHQYLWLEGAPVSGFLTGKLKVGLRNLQNADTLVYSAVISTVLQKDVGNARAFLNRVVKTDLKMNLEVSELKCAG